MASLIECFDCGGKGCTICGDGWIVVDTNIQVGYPSNPDITQIAGLSIVIIVLLVLLIPIIGVLALLVQTLAT